MAATIDLLTAALKKIGVLAPGESMSSEDEADILAELNRMLASWSADGLSLHYRKHESFTLVVGDSDYSIGSGGDFNTARPEEIEQAFIRDSSDQDHDLKVRPISEYWALSNKTSSTRPTRIYYDPTYSTGTIYFNTEPSDAETLHLICQKPLTTLASADTVSLPGEYESAIVNRLAIEIAPYFGKVVSAELALADQLSYGNLKARNLANAMKPAQVSMPGRHSGSYNIDSDE